MPAAYLHESITLAVLQRIPLPAWWEDPLTDCALIGAQGPDPLFFYNFLPPRFGTRVFKLGEAMHAQRVGQMLRAILTAAAKGEQSVKAWAAGYLSHYALDTVIHPFVYANSFSNGKYATHLHLLLEKAMDTWLYRQQGHQGIPRHFEGIRRALKPHKRIIAQAWADAAGQVFPEYGVSSKQIGHAMDGAARVGRALYSPGGRLYKLLHGVGKLLGKPYILTGQMVPLALPDNDFINASGAAWASPWEAAMQRKEGLVQLMEQAAERAEAYIRGAFQYFEDETTLEQLLTLLGTMHFSSGLDWEYTRDLGMGIDD